MSIVAFTILPGCFLLAIAVYCVAAGVRSRNPWFGVIAMFVLLMAMHQAFELRSWWVEGSFPERLMGELPETTVNILGAVIALHLVRSRVALQRQVRALEEAATIFENVQDGIFVLRMDDHGPVVARVNPAFRAAFGTGGDVRSEMRLTDALDPPVAGAIGDVVDECRRRQRPVERVVNLDQPEPDSHWHLRVAPLLRRGQVRHLVGVALDVTERQRSLKRREADLDDARVQAERANAAKSAFLARMSHELRTPLNAILGMAEVIRDRLMGDDPERYSAYAADIHASSSHLLELINDLLDIARLENERYELQPDWVDTADILHQASRMVGVRAEREGVALEADTSAPPLFADARALRQIVVNLLTNAVKFTSAGGRVTLNVTRTDTGELALTVRDSGPGIPHGEQARVLQPFEQGRERLSSDHQEGSGLGLAISRQLMTLHDGALHLDSAPGEGTAVTITFPPERVAAENPVDVDAARA